MKLQNCNFRGRKNQAGLSLLGVLIVVVIVAIFGAYIINNGRQATSKTNSTIEVQNVGMVISAIEGSKQNGTYGPASSDLSPIIIKGSMPSTWTNNSGVLTNTFTGSVTPVSTGSGFTLTLGGIPDDACVLLATKVGGNAVMTTSINGGASTTGKVPTLTATTACDGGDNSIEWTDNN